MNLAYMKDMLNVALTCDADSSIRAVVIGGGDKLFCAGGDLPFFAEQGGEDIGGLLKEVTTYLHSAISLFARMEKPVITAINGAAAGAGFSLAIMGDYAIAGRSASFTMAYTVRAVTPGTYALPPATVEDMYRPHFNARTGMGRIEVIGPKPRCHESSNPSAKAGSGWGGG